jgi:hypothetical protein
MRYILQRMRRFCGYIAGFVFYISGILKLLDPVGAGLVMDEYYNFLHLGFLGFSSKVVGALFAFAETAIGAALITGIWRKMTGLVAMVFQAFFTLLTLILVIFNPEMDCGCFGEAVHLTHMQTFLKNIVILLLLCCSFIPFRGLGKPRKKKFVSFGLVTASTIAFAVYSWMYIPLVDFTDYKVTSRLQAAEAMDVAEEDIYEAIFIYEKDGQQKEFDLMHLPDSTWTFVSTHTRLKEEYQDNTIALSIYDSEGNYQDSLAAEGKVIVISVYDPDIKAKKWDAITAVAQNASEAGFRPLVLVAGTPDDIPEGLSDEVKANLYFSDYKTLVAMNRSNGGAVYFSEGYLLRKWARRAAPDKDMLQVLMTEAETETMIGHTTQGSLVFQSFLLYVFAVMLLM